MTSDVFYDVRSLRKNKCLPAPRLMQFEITNACPLHCPQCYKPSIKNASYMSFDSFIQHINEAEELGVRQITLLGGEPLIHPSIKEMIRTSITKGIITMVVSSGLCLKDDIIDLTRNPLFFLLISLNGSCEEIHNRSRDGFFISRRAIDTLCDRNARFAINWVCRHDNVVDFENVVKLAIEKRALFVNIVCNKITSEGSVVSPLISSDYVILRNVIQRYKGRCAITIQNCYNLCSLYLNRSHASPLKGCQAGISVCAIMHDGSFMPCPHLNYREEYNSILEYWNNSVVLQKLRESVNNNFECKKCIYVNKCRFCKAMSISTHDDFNEGLTYCPIKEDLVNEV